MRSVLLAVGIASSVMFLAPSASAACTDPNLDCLLIECGPRIDDQGRIYYIAC